MKFWADGTHIFSRRWTWKKRKAGVEIQALHYILRLLSQSSGPGMWNAWLGTALFGLGVYWNAPDWAEGGQWTGIRIALLPRLHRKEGEPLYIFNWKWRIWQST